MESNMLQLNSKVPVTKYDSKLSFMKIPLSDFTLRLSISNVFIYELLYLKYGGVCGKFWYETFVQGFKWFVEKKRLVDCLFL